MKKNPAVAQNKTLDASNKRKSRHWRMWAMGSGNLNDNGHSYGYVWAIAMYEPWLCVSLTDAITNAPVYQTTSIRRRSCIRNNLEGIACETTCVDPNTPLSSTCSFLVAFVTLLALVAHMTLAVLETTHPFTSAKLVSQEQRTYRCTTKARVRFTYNAGARLRMHVYCSILSSDNGGIG